MKDYINIKLNNMHFIQRSEFSKIVVLINEKLKYEVNNIEDLPKNMHEILSDALRIKLNFDAFFENTYSEKLDGFIVTKYIGKGIKHIVIPEEIKNKRIIMGAEEIFSENEEIESISFPDNITCLGKKLCFKMPNLEKVHLGENIINIPPYCFCHCKKLTTINLKNIKSIYLHAFHGCEKLGNVNLENVEKIDTSGFEKCKSISSVYLPKIKKLLDNSFTDCIELTDVILNDELLSINSQVFSYCHKLKNIKLPEKLQTIESGAFICCYELKQIKFPESLLSINYHAFNTAGLEGEITFPSKLKSINISAFVATNIKKINISKNTKFENNCFPSDAIVNIIFYNTKIEEKTNNKKNKKSIFDKFWR